MLGLRWKQLQPPATIGTQDSRFGSLLLFPHELESRSKTGAADESVPFDLPRDHWLGPVLFGLRDGAGGDDGLMGLNGPEYRDLWSQVVETM